jgi:hypothetical protein
VAAREVDTAAPPREAPAPVPARGRAAAAKKDRASPARALAAPAAASVIEADPAAPRDCRLTVGSFPWAELWIDGHDSGQHTPVVRLPVTCGAHRLELKRDDRPVNRVEQVTVTAGQELRRSYQLNPSDFDD